jgi:hypothetical protein
MILSNKLLDLSVIPLMKTAEDITKARDLLLSKDALRQIKTKLKLPGHQIERIAHIFLF